MEEREKTAPGVWEGGQARCVVHVGGEMDADRAPMLHQALHTAITQPDGPDEIVIDLADLSFCDSSGINVLVRARHTATAHGRSISLLNPQPHFRRLLEMTGADAVFPITDT
ncbi:STAS domain-containing protein [Streptomyces sp. NPDC002886]|uniref:STAS domain-containing protein n=1 Tax=Streptomyces sp. NPDC002886 TaxID=3364667 RepID=UPI0036909ACA